MAARPFLPQHLAQNLTTGDEEFTMDGTVGPDQLDPTTSSTFGQLLDESTGPWTPFDVYTMLP